MTSVGFSLVPPKYFSGTAVLSIVSKPPFENFVQEMSVATGFPDTVHVIVWLSPSNTSLTVGEISTVSKAVSKMYDSEQNINVLIQIMPRSGF